MKKRGRPEVEDKKINVGLRLRESLIKKIEETERVSLGKAIERTVEDKYKCGE